MFSQIIIGIKEGGEKVKKRKGNRALIFLVSICLVLLVGLGILTSCSSSTPTPATSSAPPTTTVAQPIVLVFTDWDPETNTMITGVYKPWFALLEQRTGGRVKVEAHYSGQLVSLPDAYNAVLKGTVDIAHILPQTVPSFVMDSVFHVVPYDSLG